MYLSPGISQFQIFIEEDPMLGIDRNYTFDMCAESVEEREQFKNEVFKICDAKREGARSAEGEAPVVLENPRGMCDDGCVLC